VNATGEGNALIGSSVTGDGRVSAISTNGDGIRLYLDDVDFSLDDVVTIRKPSIN
jgi:hypothetical protein